MVHLVQGVGINDNSCPTKVEGKHTKEYLLWVSMLTRCFSALELKRHPTYIGCSVSDNFRHYHLFHSWCQTQIGFNKQDYQLDKDLLIKGNKQYSEDTCVFIPKELNLLFTSKKASEDYIQ